MDYTIWISAECNLKCRYCYEGQDKPLLLMNKNVAQDVIKYIKEDFKKSNDDKIEINFHGGEPFLNFDMIRYFVNEIKHMFPDKEPYFSVTTNGTILNDEILKFIVDNIQDITFSIDGTKKTHDFMRPFKNGKGSYDVVISNAKRVLEELKDYRIRMTFDSDTVNTLAEDVIHLINLGFKTIVPAANLFDKRWDSVHVEILEKQITKIKDYIKDNKEISVGICDPIDYVNRADCTGGITSKIIYTDGVIYPCLMTGGIKEFAIGDIWTGVDDKKLKSLLSNSYVENSECEGCLMAPACDATRCKIINKLVTGDFYSPPLMQCEMMNLLYRLNGICYNI